jgi:hypothetical protein
MDVRRPAVTIAMGLLVCGGTAACSGTEESVEPTCLDQPADAACQNPLYGVHGGVIAPTFDDVFTRTLQPVCGASGCHSGASPRAGMRLDDIDLAYQALTSQNAAGEDRVIPGDVQCGKVIVRLEMAGKPWSMPPGKHLDEGTLCAIRHWIANGAQR